MLTSSAETQAKSITLVRNGQAEPVRTRAATVKDLLSEQGIARTPDDALDVDPASAVTDGETISYRAAVPVTLVVDGRTVNVRSAAQTVGELLGEQRIPFDAHDRLAPAPITPIGVNDTIVLDHVNTWVEKVRTTVPIPVEHSISFTLGIGKVKVIQHGLPGQREISYRVTRSAGRTGPLKRTVIANRVLAKPHPKIVATGVGDFGVVASLAKRGYDGTIKLAKAALSMVATAYTADCSGCSGVTASGRPAGHGIVAVDPSVIPLGSHLYIPGYGSAMAGDTGGAIHGNRIDLGFNSNADALQFGRRSVTVYVLHP